MIFAILFSLLVGGAVLIAYLKFPPKYAEPRLVKSFDKMVLIVLALICLSFYFSGKINLPFSDELRESVAVIATVLLEIVFLFVCFLMRNFWIFKPPSRPGGF